MAAVRNRGTILISICLAPEKHPWDAVLPRAMLGSPQQQLQCAVVACEGLYNLNSSGE